MKQVHIFSLMIIMLATAVSCKKKVEEATPAYSCATCVRTPAALAANDNIAKGIYKGTVVGSSGVITFDLANSGNTMTALMTLDGVVVNLTASITYTAGQAIVGAFTGTLSGQPVTINFSVGATGSTPTVTSSSIPGHPNAVFTIYKETSNNLIEAFEGTYTKPSSSGTETGSFNILLSRVLGGFSAISHRNGSTSAPGTFTGSYANNTISYTPSSTETVTGTTSGDNLNGTIADQYGNGTFTGRRTL
jgi:prepilin signal peptidase PulO-like enzyme (type II secretory pathway)